MNETRRRVPWELVGLVIVVTVFALGAVFWFASPRGRGQLRPPGDQAVGAAAGIPSGRTSDSRPYLGDPEAPVTVAEIADFQCPFCRAFAEEDFATFVDDYIATGEVRWVMYLVGFDGSESLDAAVAAQCAADQDAFWPMHDWLYANASVVIDSGAFTRERLLEMASSVGLDLPSFDACLDDPSVEELVLSNETFARQLGVTASPTFVVGDRLVEGRDPRSLRDLIDASLEE